MASWWDLARALSPRRRVRVDERDAEGRWAHVYASEAPLGEREPDGPYALYLTDARQRFRLLLFDLDAKHGPVEDDLTTLTGWCDEAGLRPIVTRSGPGGGHHVWIVLAEPLSAVVVAGLTAAAARRLPSLDTPPLLNPRTGCGRPPGAPHRAGGRSEPLTTLRHAQEVLASGGDSYDAVERLLGLLHAGAPQPAPAGRGKARPTPLDADGHPHLVGPRRSLSSTGETALATAPVGMDDASKVLIRALDHAALARWRYCDVEALLDTAPGLEHARTYRPESTRPLRVPRPNPRKVLTEQWAKAVAYAADAPMPDVDDDRGDPEFEARASTVSTAAAAVQQRAGAAPGRWARPGGPSDRRILDALCLLALQAVRLDVEADLRRLALLTGLGRTTVDRALHRLAAEGWLLHHTPGAGVRGARWALPPAPTGAVENSSLASSTTGMFIDGSQAIPRPAGAQESNPRPARAAWLTRLSNRLVLLARDVFTPSGLGHHAARVYEALSVQHRTSPEISEVTGYNIRRVHSLLEDLAHHRLAQPTDANTWRRGTGSCTTSAKALGVHGVLAARQRRYIDERLVWAWWNEEVLWMHQPRKRKYARRRRTPGTGQGALPIGPNLTTRERLGPFPRRLSGRADFPAATAHVRARRRARTTTAVVAAAA